MFNLIIPVVIVKSAYAVVLWARRSVGRKRMSCNYCQQLVTHTNQIRVVVNWQNIHGNNQSQSAINRVYFINFFANKS